MAEEDIRDFLRNNPETIKVEVQIAEGSTPREKGAWMLVSPSALFMTIGGGQLEYMAIDRCRMMLREGVSTEAMNIPLGPEIGQCCGGRVELGLTLVDDRIADALVAETDRMLANQPHVYLFGAGHVGNSLARALSLLPVRTVLVDTRASELEHAPKGIETCLTAMPEALVREAPAGSVFVILTHEHSLDFLIASEALKRGDANYVGMIGSKTKRATFRSWFHKHNEGGSSEMDNLVCPIGKRAVDDKRPAVIASLVAAEIVEALDWKAEESMSADAQSIVG